MSQKISGPVMRMKVKVKTLADIWEAVGKKRELVVELEEGATILDLVNKLVERYGESLKKILMNEEGGLSSSIIVLINRTEVKKEVEGTVLKNGDEVTFMPPVAGGS